MINKVIFYKLLGSIAGLVLWALATAQPAYAHPALGQIAPHQHGAKPTMVAFEELTATLNTECLAGEDKNKLLTSPKLSKALAELVEHYNVSLLQDDEGGSPCPFCSCTQGGMHKLLCNWYGTWCRIEGGHDCIFMPMP